MKDTREIAKDYTDWMVKTGGFARDMTLRDHFAGLAMQSMLLKPSAYDACASWAYRQADAMIKERAE